MPLGSKSAVPQIRQGYEFMYKGDYKRGLPLLEYRLPNKYPIGGGTRTVYSKAPIWYPGVSFKDQNVVVVLDGGRGDLINFCRYLPLLTDLGAKSIYVICTPEMVGLMKRLGIKAGTKPPDDVEKPCMRLHTMSIMAAMMENGLFPGEPVDKHYKSEGYLRNPNITEKTDKIGLCWYTNSDSWNAKYRQINSRFVENLVKKYPNQEFVSLQLEGTFLTSVLVRDSMSGSADEIQKLKAVVSIDTSILHLAGAIGVPTYGMVGNGREIDWRWLPKKEECSWYDSVKLVYNEPHNNWEAAMKYSLDQVCR